MEIRPYCLLPCLLLFVFYTLPASGQLHAEFSSDVSGGCRPLRIHFTDHTTGASANALYQWDFGNGNASGLAAPEAVYVEEGSYTVTLTIKDGGNTSTIQHTITVYQPPVVSFSVNTASVCQSSPVTLTSGSTAGSGVITTYLWDFGDGITQQGSASQPHTYDHQGVPIVSLTITNSNGCTSSLEQKDLFKVLPPVTADFTIDKKVLCNITDPVQFTNASTGTGALSYTWDFGDGHTSTQTNPSYAFSQKGTYTVKLTATSAEGCSANVTKTDAVNVANYTADIDLPATACQGVALDIADKSLPVPDSRVWQVDGTNAGTDAVLKTSFSATGVHTVKLTGSFGACTQSVTKQVTVQAAPALTDFDIDLLTKCGGPTDVKLTDHTAGAVSWDWNFQYDPNDPYPNITHQGPSVVYNFYTNYRIYFVQLTVANAGGCKSSLIKQVMITAPAIHIYQNDNVGESSCNTPITKTLDILEPDQLQSWVWDFGDGTSAANVQTPQHTYTAIGQYNAVINYVTKDGCKGVSNAVTSIVAKPLNLDFSMPSTTVCANSNILIESPSLYAANPMYSSWEFGDGTISSFYPQHIYTTPGVYTVTLHAENEACQTTVTKTNFITVLPDVGAYTGFANTCDLDRDVVTFNFRSGSATSLVWDFGDGKQETTDGSVTKVTHTYAAAGIYEFTVKGGNAYCNVSGADEVAVFKKQKPVLTADKSSICPDGTVAVSISNYDINPWTWITSSNYTVDFQYGDSTEFQGTQTPDYFSWGNVYSGKLSNFNGGKSGLRVITTSVHFGCKDTSNIVPLLVLGASAGYEAVSDHQCFQSPVVLKDTSKVSAGNSILSWSWDFGDGQTSTQNGTVSHLYAKPGSYDVKLTITDASGCPSITSHATSQVVVNGPMAAFAPSATNVPLNKTVTFSNTTNDYGSTPVWHWDFGDGQTSADPNPSHAYTSAGTFTVTLTAKDQVTGCTSTATAAIVVDPFGASFAISGDYVSKGHCPPMLVHFTNQSINYTSIQWDFGDGATAEGLDAPDHVYEKAGQYTVTLTVRNAGGLSAQYTSTVTVTQPTASLSTTTPAICVAQQAQMKATSSATAEYTWDFGDGSLASGADAFITHTYNRPGDYKPRLLVTGKDGCTVTADGLVDLQVHPPPAVMAKAASPYVCLNSQVLLTASGGQTYSWTPALGLDRADIASPTASPATNTEYTVTVTDDIGCQNTGKVSVEVVQPVTVRVVPATVNFCPGGTVQLHATGAVNYTWINNVDGLSNIHTADPKATPVSSGTYTVTGSDAHACFTDRATVQVTVLPVPVVNAGLDVEVLAGTPVTLDATANSNVRWTWTPAAGLSCTDCASPVCTPKQTTQYIVTGKNDEGCSASDTVVVKLACEEARVAVPNVFTPNGDGHNDRFVIQGINEIDHLVIYGRWGQKVFERSHFIASDPASCWDGYMNGQPQPVGVYTYFIEMHCPAGGVFTMKGTVMLVR